MPGGQRAGGSCGVEGWRAMPMIIMPWQRMHLPWLLRPADYQQAAQARTNLKGKPQSCYLAQMCSRR